MEKELSEKYEKLKEQIKRLDRAIIAFSGGIDSALLLKVCHDILGDKAIAVTADSPSLPRRELEETKNIAQEIGARHTIINTEETQNKEYLKNPSNRCYYCKSELYFKLKIIAKEMNANEVLNGTNMDDLGDYRPGLKAADEFKIISPLKGAGFTKQDIRELAKHIGLSMWKKPSSPCLSSRVPYGQEITMNKLRMIENAENFLKDLGIEELRVRHFGDTAKIEVNDSEREKINENITTIEEKFCEIGFSSIFVEKFKSGNLNMMIK